MNLIIHSACAPTSLEQKKEVPPQVLYKGS